VFWDGREGYQTLLNIDMKRDWYEFSLFADSFVSLLYFVAQIILSFVGLVQANFLQATVDYKKKDRIQR
jgi:hypothetical protein